MRGASSPTLPRRAPASGTDQAPRLGYPQPGRGADRFVGAAGLMGGPGGPPAHRRAGRRGHCASVPAAPSGTPTLVIAKRNPIGRDPSQISRILFAPLGAASWLDAAGSVRRWLSARALAVRSTWVRARGFSNPTRSPGRRSPPAEATPAPSSSMLIAAVCQLVAPAAGSGRAVCPLRHGLGSSALPALRHVPGGGTGGGGKTSSICTRL